MDTTRFFEISYDLLFAAALDGSYIHVNPAWTAILGWPRAEIEDNSLLRLIHEEDVPVAGRAVADLQAYGHARARCRLLAQDGSYRTFDWHVVHDTESGKLHAAGRDVTEDVALREDLAERERTLARLVAAQLEARDHEHARISGQLHDRAVQHCVAALMHLEADDPDEAGDQVTSALEAIRDVIGRLDAPDSSITGLEDAIDAIVGSVGRQFSLEVDIDRSVTRNVAPDIAATACRVVREGLINAAKHAGPGPVRVEVHTGDGSLRVAVRDSGITRGEPSSERPRGFGLGLSLLRESVGRHGGALVFEPATDGGVLRAELPLSSAAAPQAPVAAGDALT